MFYSKKDVLNEINEIDTSSGILNVRVFEDNRHLDVDVNITSTKLFSYFKKLDFDVGGGESLEEFYIVVNGRSLTIKVIDIETVEELDLA